MPFLNIQLMKGRSLEQKRKLVESVTKAVCESIDSTPEKVRIVLSEMEADDCAVGGVLVVDKDDSYYKYGKK
jgi:4-oxalocrotonate tautomerase